MASATFNCEQTFMHNGCLHSLDDILREAWPRFTHAVLDGSWRGKEREAVSLFAFGYLVPHCRPGRALFDAAQIGVEVRVPSPAGRGVKREICKDLVIWSAPAATCWSVDAWPLAILEWKFGQPEVCAADVAWLAAFSAGRPDFVGYAVAVDPRGRHFKLACTRVHDQHVHPEWLVISP